MAFFASLADQDSALGLSSVKSEEALAALRTWIDDLARDVVVEA